MSNAACLYRNVPARWGAHVYSDTVVTRLVKAAHGDASGVRGAALVEIPYFERGGREKSC